MVSFLETRQHLTCLLEEMTSAQGSSWENGHTGHGEQVFLTTLWLCSFFPACVGLVSSREKERYLILRTCEEWRAPILTYICFVSCYRE